MYEARDDRYDRMSYARTGSSGLLLPKISLSLWHNLGGDALSETGRDMLLNAFDHGIRESIPAASTSNR